jgi:hypothetical protein
MQAQMAEFVAQLDAFEEKLGLFSQDIRTLMSNINLLSTEVERLQAISLQRIVEKSEKESKAEQIKADNEAAKELAV